MEIATDAIFEALLFFGKSCQTVAVMLCEIIIDFREFGPVLLFGFFQIVQRGLQNGETRLSFFRVQLRAAGQTKCPDERRQTESLKHQCNEDDVECQKDDEIAL